MRRVATVAALAAAGIAVGLGLFTFVYAKGWSYLTNDPKACANCHVMTEQYEGWLKASHRSVAVAAAAEDGGDQGVVGSFVS